MLRKTMFLALTALAPLALAAPSFAADTAAPGPVAKPVVSDSAAPAGKTVKKAPARTGTAEKHGAIDEVWTTKSAQNDKPVTSHSATKPVKDTKPAHDKSTTEKNAAKSGSAGNASSNSGIGVTGSAASRASDPTGHGTTTTSGLTSSMTDSAKASSAAKEGTVTHSGSSVTPDSKLNPAGKP
jgi:hypothetical protein